MSTEIKKMKKKRMSKNKEEENVRLSSPLGHNFHSHAELLYLNTIHYTICVISYISNFK
jgi:hypothetical protein